MRRGRGYDIRERKVKEGDCREAGVKSVTVMEGIVRTS